MIRGAAAMVAILCLRAAAQEPAACTIGGMVVDEANGKPVAHARMIAGVAGRSSFLKLTDEKGAFCFDNLEAGVYQLSTQKSRYLEDRITVEVTAGEPVAPVKVRLSEEATISGTAFDSEGDTVPGAEVSLWDRTRTSAGWEPELLEVVDVDKAGAFRITGLAPGTYFLSVTANHDLQRFAIPFADTTGKMPREREVDTYYSGSITFAGATAIPVKAGAQVGGLVLALRKSRLRQLSGKVTNPPSELFLTYQAENGGRQRGLIPVAKDGSFVQIGIPPGPYVLHLSDGKRKLAQRVVDLTYGDTTGVILVPEQPADIPVIFRTEGSGAEFQPGASRTLLAMVDGDDAIRLQKAGDGTYRFPNVAHGMYRLRLDLEGQRLYVKSVAYGGETQTGNKVDLRSFRDGGHLEVTLSPNVAQVEGRIPAAGDERDVTVVLVNADGIAERADVDTKGRFRMPLVAPGQYRLYAIAGFNEDYWDGEALEKLLLGRELSLDLKERETKNVSVKAIPEEEWQAALKKVRG